MFICPYCNSSQITVTLIESGQYALSSGNSLRSISGSRVVDDWYTVCAQCTRNLDEYFTYDAESDTLKAKEL